MNNDFYTKQCLNCFNKRTYIIDSKNNIDDHPIPRDMFYLTRNNDIKYMPIPLNYTKRKKIINYKNNPNIGLCNFCSRKDMLNERYVFNDLSGRGILNYSETGGKIVGNWSIL